MRLCYRLLAAVCVSVAGAAWFPAHADQTYELEVFPRQDMKHADAFTGVELTTLSVLLPATNLYFHQRSWLPDGSMIVFDSDRGLMGYLCQTGELVVLEPGSQKFRDRPTVAATRNSVFAIRGTDEIEFALDIDISADPGTVLSKVTATERVIARLSTFCPHGCGKLNGSYDDTYLVTYNEPYILTITVATGEVQRVCTIGPPIDWRSHVQSSRGPSNLLSFAGGPDWHTRGDPDRLWVVDPAEGVPRPVHHQIAGELVTHESWWVGDQILFCGAPPAVGFEDEPSKREMSHVNVLDPRTGIVRILGAGNWWPEGTDAEVWKRNWWHCAGSDDGRWVVADTFHGDIVLFEGKTGRPRVLTTGHRTYGGGEHPHPSFDPTGSFVVFTSNRSGIGRVCVAKIPDEWRAQVEPWPTGMVRAETEPAVGVAPHRTGPAIDQNAPNPFNPRTIIRYRLSAEQRITIAVHDLAGRPVRVLVDNVVQPGAHVVVWDGLDTRGRSMGSGVYLCRVATSDGTMSRRLTLLR